MPYIRDDQRGRFDKLLKCSEDIQNAGEANYVLTKILSLYLKRKGQNYQNINEVIGILECCKLEYYRRCAANYEDSKIQENGDVF